MTAALRNRIAELEEEIRQIKAAFAPKVGFPLSWRLDEREGAVLSALFHTKGSYVTAEALLRLIVGFDDDAGEGTVQTWVGRLRRKLEPHGVGIVTRTQQGYALDGPGRTAIAEALGVSAPSAPDRPANPKGWCEDQDAIVRAGYGRRAPLSVIRVELMAAGHRARSFGSISQRAQTLGFASDRAAALWTPPEDEILRAAYDDGAPIAAIRLALAEAGFRRNRGAIQMRAIALGVAGKRTRVWTQPEKAIVRAGLDAEHTFETVRLALEAKGYDRGLTAIVRLAHKMGVNRATTPWTEAEYALLRRLYAEKRPVAAIAAEIGRRVPAVASMASRLGLKQRLRWTDDDRARLLRAFEDGETLDLVCRDIGRPLANVSTEARRLGLQFPPTPRRAQIRDLAA